MLEKGTEIMITLEKAINEFILEKSIQVRPATIGIYEGHKSLLLQYFDKNLPLNEFSKQIFIEYISSLKCGNTTKNKRINFIKMILRSALDNEHIFINKDISFILKFKKLKESPKHYQTIQDDDMHKLIDYYNNMPQNTYLHYRNKIIIGMCLQSGLRRTELIHLKIDNINFDEDSIYLEYTKSGNSRKAYFIKEFSNLIKDYIIKYPNRKYLFESNAGKQLDAEAITMIFKRLSEKLGFNLITHDLRHTFASKLASDGIDIYSLKDLLGHTNLKTTQIYIDEGCSNLSKAAKTHNLFNIYNKGEKII